MYVYIYIFEKINIYNDIFVCRISLLKIIIRIIQVSIILKNLKTKIKKNVE